MADTEKRQHTTWCSTNRWNGRGSDPCNCPSALLAAQETFEAAHAPHDESVILAFFQVADWSATTRRFSSEHIDLTLTLSARVTPDDLAAIQRLLKG